MSQAVSAPITGAHVFTGGKSDKATDMSAGIVGRESPRVVALPVRLRLRSDVPPFDPANPAHIRAWEALYDFGQFQARGAVA